MIANAKLEFRMKLPSIWELQSTSLCFMAPRRTHYFSRRPKPSHSSTFKSIKSLPHTGSLITHHTTMLFARNSILKALEFRQTRRSMATSSMFTPQKYFVAISALTVAALVMAPQHEFDDLDCQNFTHDLDNPDHPYHYHSYPFH